MYAQLNGHYDFNRAPIAQPGTRFIPRGKPDKRANWAPHGMYDDYRFYMIDVSDARSDRVVDTVEFLPARVAMPHTASKELSMIAAQELMHALLHPPHAPPFSTIIATKLQAPHQLDTVFDDALPATAPTGTPITSPQHVCNSEDESQNCAISEGGIHQCAISEGARMVQPTGR
jgi:hypothetical protein